MPYLHVMNRGALGVKRARSIDLPNNTREARASPCRLEPGLLLEDRLGFRGLRGVGGWTVNRSTQQQPDRSSAQPATLTRRAERIHKLFTNLKPPASSRGFRLHRWHWRDCDGQPRVRRRSPGATPCVEINAATLEPCETEQAREHDLTRGAVKWRRAAGQSCPLRRTGDREFRYTTSGLGSAVASRFGSRGATPSDSVEPIRPLPSSRR